MGRFSSRIAKLERLAGMHTADQEAAREFFFFAAADANDPPEVQEAAIREVREAWIAKYGDPGAGRLRCLQLTPPMRHEDRLALLD